MKIFGCLLITLAAIVNVASAQEKAKPWTEWSKKDAEKILNDSAWGQTQTIESSDSSSTSAITKTQGAGNESVSRSGQSGENLGPKSVSYRARFLTARPVREAFARLMVLSQPNAGKDLTDQLQGFIDRDFGKYLVVAFTVDSSDPKMGSVTMAAMARMNADVLKGKVYLERKDGKRLELLDYKPPIADNMGAKFVFERDLDGQPFLTQETESVKFVMEPSERLKVNLRFKVPAMLYNGELEY
jgi:hypothetical protein